MTKGTILFLERQVIGNDPQVVHYPSKDYFEYSNGSILAYAGLEDAKARERLKSIGHDGAVDIAWLEEATEFERADFDAVQARMRGKAADWQQIILSTNPDAPTHWIYTDLIVGKQANVYYSNAADNPYNPPDYIKNRLGSLQGVEFERMAKGEWVQASGLVYDTWSEQSNVTESADYIPDCGDIYWGVDDGYAGKRDPITGFFTAESHPRVFLFFQLRSNGDLCLFDERYDIQRLSVGHIEEIKALPYPDPVFVAVDKSAAELKGTLHAAGYYTQNSPSSVEESIKEMRKWISADSNGYRRLKVHPRCKHFRSEIVSYVYDKVTGKPVKQFDHGPDAARYLIYNLRYE